MNHDGQRQINESDPRLFDTDGDGLSDGREDRDQNGRQTLGETSALLADTDGGGHHDGVEMILALDPLDPRDDIERLDTDGDGLPDDLED